MLEPNKLRGLKIGSLPLGFDPDNTDYAVTTTNASNTITVTCDYPFTITVNGIDQENTKSANWQDGTNILLITVEGGLTYTVTVSK